MRVAEVLVADPILGCCVVEEVMVWKEVWFCVTLSFSQKMNFQDGVEHGSLSGACFGHCRSSGLLRLFLNWLRIVGKKLHRQYPGPELQNLWELFELVFHALY